jgi:hypothetical protein
MWMQRLVTLSSQSLTPTPLSSLTVVASLLYLLLLLAVVAVAVMVPAVMTVVAVALATVSMLPTRLVSAAPSLQWTLQQRSS